MCGIVGARDSWLRQQGLEPRAALATALQRLRWRGADGLGLLQAGDWWLGCARLAISEPRSRQPVVQRHGRLVGVLNGAITNAADLWARFRPRLAGRSELPNDAWLPLLAVAQDRLDLLALAHGHRAAAVVDTHTDELFVAVDPCGEKPLFAIDDGGVVAFASTVPALRAFGAAPPELDLPAWFRRGFAALRPATARPAIVPWPRAAAVWRLRRGDGWHQAAIAAAPQPAMDPRGLQPVLQHAVARCSDTARPAALCLSGGIDSSCVAASLHAIGRPLPAYQFQAIGAGADERDVARQVAARCGLALQLVDGGPEILDALPALIAAHGLPLGDPSVLALHALARRAAADGVRVLLSGEGADELLLGYRRHRALHWLDRSAAALRLGSRLVPRWANGVTARLLRAAALPTRSKRYATLQSVVPPAFLAEVLAPLPDPLAEEAVATDGASFARAQDLLDYLPHDLLPKLDVATLAAGVEGRCPFLDPEVVGWALQRPAASLLGKRPLCAEFASALPGAVFRQPKRGLALPLDRWWRLDWRWLDVLREARTLQRPWLRPAGVARAIDRHRRGEANLGHGLYLVLAMELHQRAEEQRSCA